MRDGVVFLRDYMTETEKRVEFIQGLLLDSGAQGIVFGNSGGKDSALVGILCKYACPDTVGVIMPCGSNRNYNEDLTDALDVAQKYGIGSRTADLGEPFEAIKRAISSVTEMHAAAAANIAPRLRMLTLYAIAASERRLVAGTGNFSERYMGYFTKWGDGAYDFNPIADLTVTEVYEYLRYLDAPLHIIEKAPSAGLFDGQTDEAEMGVSYRSIDAFLRGEHCTPEESEIIAGYHSASEHKRRAPAIYGAKDHCAPSKES